MGPSQLLAVKLGFYIKTNSLHVFRQHWLVLNLQVF